MRRRHWRIALLALGVVIGYGSAIRRAWHGDAWYDDWGHCHHHHHGRLTDEPATSDSAR